jgi:hypothetical protein
MSGRARRAWAVLSLATLVPAGAALAAPGDPGIELAWTAPAECPTREFVLAEVERIVGPGGVRRPVLAEASVLRRADGRWTLRLRTQQDEDVGERLLEGDTCRGVASAAAVVLALTVQTEAVVVTPVPSASAPAPPASSSAPPADSTPTPKPPPPPSPWTFLARGTGVVDFVTLPSVAGGAGIALGARYRRLEATLGFTVLFDQSATTSKPGAGADFSLIRGALRTCYVAPLRAGASFEVLGCGGVEVDRVAARSYGVTTPGSGEFVHVAPFVGSGFIVVATPAAALGLDVGVLFPLARPGFAVEGLGELHRVPPVTLRIGLTVDLRL